MTLKLISKIILIGAFFCGTLGQASSLHALLSFNEFMSLNKAQKVAYVSTLRDALMRAEKAQHKKGVKYQAQNQVPNFPDLQSLFFSEALAADSSKYCIYGANISSRSGDYCHTLTGGVCTDPAVPSQCNNLLFGNNVCVAVPSDKYKVNDATQACFDKVLMGKTPEQTAAINQKIVDEIVDNEQNRTAWNDFSTRLDSYCGEANQNSWRDMHQKDLCARVMARRDDMRRALDKKFSKVPAEAPHPDVSADLPIVGGCDYTVDLGHPDARHTFHIDYTLDHGQFRVINHAPPSELFSDNTTSDNCEDGKTLPHSCDLFIRKTTYVEGKEVIQGFKLTGANATGGSGGSTSCTVEHFGEDIHDPDAEEADDIVDCNKADIGSKTQLFCVGENEGIYKAVIYVDHGHHGENGVRVCEASHDYGNDLPGPKWNADKDSTSAMDKKINNTSLAMAKDKGIWWKLGLGKKTIEMRFNDGTEQRITRHKPKGGDKMVGDVQQCDFSNGETASNKDPNGNSKYFTISGLETSDGKGNAANRAPKTSH